MINEGGIHKNEVLVKNNALKAIGTGSYNNDESMAL